jgi:hypothetical protein
VFASETLGDYLFWALPDPSPVMMHGQAQLFPPRRWQEALRVKQGEPDWWEILDLRQANLVVVETDKYPELTRQLRQDPRWEISTDQTGDSGLFIALRRRPRTVPGGPR